MQEHSIFHPPAGYSVLTRHRAAGLNTENIHSHAPWHASPELTQEWRAWWKIEQPKRGGRLRRAEWRTLVEESGELLECLKNSFVFRKVIYDSSALPTAVIQLEAEVPFRSLLVACLPISLANFGKMWPISKQKVTWMLMVLQKKRKQ